MSIEENKAIIKKLFDGLSRADLSVIDECLAPDFVRHAPGWEDMGIEGYKRVRSQSLSAMPSKTIVDEIVCEGDRAAFRVTHKGVQSGSMFGRPVSNRSFEVSEVYFARFEQGKVKEWWCLLDRSTMESQLSGTTQPLRKVN